MSEKIPKSIQLGGKNIEYNEQEYNAWALESGKRAIAFANMEPIKFKIGEMRAEFDPREVIQIDNEKMQLVININNPGAKRRDEMVGIGGVYCHPNWFGANNAEEAIAAWDWFFQETRITKEQITIIEAYFVMRLISSGQNQIQTYRILALASALKHLHDKGVNVESKLSEIGNKIRGNFRAFKRLNKKNSIESWFRIMELIKFLSDMSAESSLAEFAMLTGHNVKICKHPDILIDDVKVEVKYDRKESMSNETSLLGDIEKGLRQKGQLICIFTGDFRQKKLKKFKLRWLATTRLLESLNFSLRAAKNGKKCVLLFSGSYNGYVGRIALIN